MALPADTYVRDTYGRGVDITALAAQVDALPTGRLLSGKVAADGTLVGGAGFTPAAGGAGIYSITFSTPFASAPAVTVTHANTAVALSVGATSTTTAISIRIRATVDDTLTAAAFSFTVTGA